VTGAEGLRAGDLEAEGWRTLGTLGCPADVGWRQVLYIYNNYMVLTMTFGVGLGLAFGLDPATMQWLSDLVRVWLFG